MLVRWWHIVLVVVVAPLAIVLAAWIGFFNVGASTGHWQVTEWFLHFAMRSAIRTYAIPIDAPDELPVEGVQPAAGHYAQGCAVCHGAPGEPRSPTVLGMLPLPPDLEPVIDDWSNAQLFRIVKHGVRFTGMPAWPTQARADEVWSMVAFLRALPGMDPARYRELAYGGAAGEAVAPRAGALADCVRCHGEDGMGKSGLVPIIAGQSEAYLIESLRAYAESRRASGIMALPATAAGPEQWPALARHFASQERKSAGGEEFPPELLEAGQAIAERGIPEEGVPACLSCHGVNPRNPVFPELEGQNAAYLAAQLRLFRTGNRGGTHYSHLMATVARGLSDKDIAAASAFFASRPARP